MVTINASFDLRQKSQIIAAIDNLEQAVTTKLDHLEQAVRELLQIVCSQPKFGTQTLMGSTGTCLGFDKRVCEFQAH
jgi:hypothetical protein